MRPRWTSLALIGGILAVSAASIFVRYAQVHAGSLVIAAGRLAIATLVLAPVALTRHRDALRALTRRDLALALASGALLALHFSSWILSLEKTSVIDSVVLVTTTPLWVALLAPVTVGERLSRAALFGILIALAGGLVIATGAGTVQGGVAHPPAERLTGDLLALLGGWAMAAYLIVGRRIRARLALVPYVFIVYGAAALVLVAAVFASGQRVTGLPPSTWGWIVLLALVPQLIGHSTFNWALRHLPATPVAIVLFGEPLGATVLAWLILAETPSAARIVGAAVILAGVFIAARGSTTVEPEPAG